jgi:hypothetical protein
MENSTLGERVIAGSHLDSLLDERSLVIIVCCPADHGLRVAIDNRSDSVECSFVAVHRIRVTWESSQVRTAFGRQSLLRSDST